MKQYHIEGFEDLTLITRSVTIQSEGDIRFFKILLCEGETSTKRDLSAYDAVSAKEGWREYMHRASLSV